MRPPKNLGQNIVCFEQQIYAHQENFTQPLVVMVETFIRSVTEVFVEQPLAAPGSAKNIVL